MKKVFLLVTIITNLLFVSCSDDDSSSEGNSIIGKWQITSIIDNENETANDCDKMGTYEFTSDTISLMIYDIKTQDLQQDGTVTVDCKIVNNERFTYSINGNKLIFDGEEYPFSISGNNLIVNFSDEEGSSVITLKRI